MQELVAIYFDEIEESKECEEKVIQVINKCFDEERLKNLNLYISITLTTPKRIKELNKQYRKIDKETDVLSFPMFEKHEIDELVKKQEKLPLEETIGDIVISVQRVQQQAKEYGHGFKRELSYMLVHGFYHLMGYDHIEEEDKKIMREKEEKVLNELNILR